MSKNPQKISKFKMLLTHEYLLSALTYDGETGIFTWNKRPDMPASWNAKYAGKVAGCVKRDRCVRVTLAINNIPHYAHRLAWFYHYKAWPTELVDHINCDATDNRISNLRAASNAQNLRNRGKTKLNTTGFKGVTFDKKNKRWDARICIKNRTIHLGGFSKPEDASLAYEAAAKRIHGEFYRVA